MEIKGYSIIKEINRGPITTVCMANQTALDRVVLLKVFNSQWQKDHDLVERFRREAKIYARLKHPHIVNIYDFSEAGEFYLAMEYVEGFDLADFIAKHSPLPFPITLFIFKQILKGLSYAHKKGILHRDIKPSNILIGKDGSVKITDFGIATIQDFPALTEQGNTLGTPAYMSPEQAMGQKLDVRSDLFSLGIAIYEMLGGVSIFQDSNFIITIDKVMNFNPEPIQKKRADVEPWFSNLLTSLLQKKIEKRPQSAQEILEMENLNQFKFTADDLRSFIQSPDDFDFKVIHKDKQVKTAPKHKSIFKPVIYSSLIIILLVISGWYFILRESGVNYNNIKADSTLTNGLIEPETGKTENDLSEAEFEPEQQSGAEHSSEISGRKAPLESTPKISDTKVTNLTYSDGGLFIICYPWAEIYIDRQHKETTPLNKSIPLSPGRHHIELKNPNYNSYTGEILTKSSKVETLNVVLKPALGFLDIQVSPWAEVYIDGKLKGTTPLKKSIALMKGEHIIKLINPNFSSFIDTIKIEVGKTIKRRIPLTK